MAAHIRYHQLPLIYSGTREIDGPPSRIAQLGRKTHAPERPLEAAAKHETRQQSDYSAPRRGSNKTRK